MTDVKRHHPSVEPPDASRIRAAHLGIGGFAPRPSVANTDVDPCQAPNTPPDDPISVRESAVPGFTGAVYPVNARADVVQSLTAYRTLSDIPAAVELAVVVVPAEQVVGVARDCATAGVRALLVISAGFAETGDAGGRRQRELLDICRGAGMRLVGPNCLGVLNTAREVRLNATFAPRQAPAGRVGLLSQSGGVGIAIIEAAERLGVGLSSFVSVGSSRSRWITDDDRALPRLQVRSMRVGLVM